MAKYKGRDVTILENFRNELEENQVVILTKEGLRETVKKSEVTIYDPKEVPDLLSREKEDKLYAFRIATQKEVEEMNKQKKIDEAKAIEDAKVAEKEKPAFSSKSTVVKK